MTLLTVNGPALEVWYMSLLTWVMTGFSQFQEWESFLHDAVAVCENDVIPAHRPSSCTRLASFGKTSS